MEGFPHGDVVGLLGVQPGPEQGPTQDLLGGGIPTTQTQDGPRECLRGNGRVARARCRSQPPMQEPSDELVPYTRSLSFLFCILGLSAYFPRVWPLSPACNRYVTGLFPGSTWGGT